jgi:Zn-dependent peptidase ImmA (M78 family)
MKKAFQVFGQEIKVELQKGPLFVDGEHCLGYYDTEKKLIVIDKGLPLTTKLQTLYHELGHALLYRLGLEKTSLHHDVHEIIVEGYAKFISDNFKMK